MSESEFQVHPGSQLLVHLCRMATACAGRLNTIDRPVFHETVIAMLNSQSWGSGDWGIKSRLVKRWVHRCRL